MNFPRTLIHTELNTEELLEEKVAKYKSWTKTIPFLYDRMINQKISSEAPFSRWLTGPTTTLTDTHLICKGPESTKFKTHIQTHSLHLPILELPDGNPRNPPMSSIYIPLSMDLMNSETTCSVDGFVTHSCQNLRDGSLFCFVTGSTTIHLFQATQSLTISDDPQPPNFHSFPSPQSLPIENMSWSSPLRSHLLLAHENELSLFDVERGMAMESRQLCSFSFDSTISKTKSTPSLVNWFPTSPHVFSHCLDRNLLLWDTRQALPLNNIHNLHSHPILSISPHPSESFLLLTSSVDQTCALWDLRHFTKPLHLFQQHSHPVTHTQWHPTAPSVFMSGASDGTVVIWDSSLIGAEQTPDERLDGAPEILFVHGGHFAAIEDLQWHPNFEWVVSSVDRDGILMIWEINHMIHSDYPPVPNVALEDASLFE